VWHLVQSDIPHHVHGTVSIPLSAGLARQLELVFCQLLDYSEYTAKMTISLHSDVIYGILTLRSDKNLPGVLSHL